MAIIPAKEYGRTSRCTRLLWLPADLLRSTVSLRTPQRGRMGLRSFGENSPSTRRLMSVLSMTSPDLGSVFTARPDERLAVCRGNCGTAFIEKTFRSAPVIPIKPCFREVDRVWSDYAETDQTYASHYQMFIKKKVKGLGRLLKKGIDALRIKMRCQSTETSPRAVEDILARLDPRFLSPVSSPKAIEDILAFLDPRF